MLDFARRIEPNILFVGEEIGRIRAGLAVLLEAGHIELVAARMVVADLVWENVMDSLSLLLVESVEDIRRMVAVVGSRWPEGLGAGDIRWAVAGRKRLDLLIQLEEGTARALVELRGSLAALEELERRRSWVDAGLVLRRIPVDYRG
jgi:hypothetical protein